MSFYTAKIEILQKQIETVQEEIEIVKEEIESVEKELESIVSKKYESWERIYDMKKEQLDDLRQDKHCHLVSLAELRNALSQLMVTEETPFKKPRNLIHGEFA